MFINISQKDPTFFLNVIISIQKNANVNNNYKSLLSY